MSDQSKSGTKEVFASTAEIWRWLLEKSEVNRVKHECGDIEWLQADGNLSGTNEDRTGDFSIPERWSKFVEEKKVTISRDDLAREWNKHIAGTNFSRLEPEQSAPFDYFCKGLGL